MVVGDIATTTDVIVLGAGPGGYVAALRAAQLGKAVILVDPNPPGGACLHQSCIPAKALLTAAHHYWQIPRLEQLGIVAGAPQLNLEQMQWWKNRLIKRLAAGITQLLDYNKVGFIQGKGWFLSDNELHVEAEHGAERYIFEHAIIAVGASPAPLPNIIFNDDTVLTPWQALELTRLPGEIAVIGADTIAAELATLFAKLGSSTHLVIPTGQTWLPEFPTEAGQHLLTALRKLGVTIEQDEHDPASATAACKMVVVATGQTPNTGTLRLDQVGVKTDDQGYVLVNDQLQTSNPAVYAVGDVTGGPPLAHVAIRQGKVAAESLAGQPAQFAPQAVPRVVWTEPQLATVGLSAAQAKNAGYQVITGRFPLAANGRALTLGDSDGLVQTVAEAGTEVLLGVTIIGPHAETLIGEAALALEMGATLTDLAETLHPHPGLGEALQEAAEAALGGAVHLKNNGAETR